MGHLCGLPTGVVFIVRDVVVRIGRRLGFVALLRGGASRRIGGARRNRARTGLGMGDRTGDVVARIIGIFDRIAFGIRSEGHTSELQSLMRISYAVFCLKQKKT